MAIANNNTNQIASRYRVMAAYSPLKINTRVVKLTSDPTPPLTDFTTTFLETGQY